MSCERFDPNCRHCMPVMLDMETRKPLPDDHPLMLVLMRAWRAASRDEQEAFWRVTIKNSRDPSDLQLCRRILSALEAN
jgi:hypothetical protein